MNNFFIISRNCTHFEWVRYYDGTHNVSASGGLKIRKKLQNNIPQNFPNFFTRFVTSNNAVDAGWELDANGTRCDHHIANHSTFKYESFVWLKNFHYHAHYDTNYDANHYANHGANFDANHDESSDDANHDTSYNASHPTNYGANHDANYNAGHLANYNANQEAHQDKSSDGTNFDASHDANHDDIITDRENIAEDDDSHIGHSTNIGNYSSMIYYAYIDISGLTNYCQLDQLKKSTIPAATTKAPSATTMVLPTTILIQTTR